MLRVVIMMVLLLFRLAYRWHSDGAAVGGASRPVEEVMAGAGVQAMRRHVAVHHRRESADDESRASAAHRVLPRRRRRQVAQSS